MGGRVIDVGGTNRFSPFVVGPSGVPWITSHEHARNDPELVVLSAMTYGKDPDVERSVQVAIAAQMASLGLEGRSRLYCDLVQHALKRGRPQGVIVR